MTPLGNGTTTLMYAAYLQAFGGYNRAGYSAAISDDPVRHPLVVTIVQLRSSSGRSTTREHPDQRSGRRRPPPPRRPPSSSSDGAQLRPGRPARARASLIFGGYLPLILATLIIALPLLWMVLGSFKTSSEISRELVWLPGSPSLDAYRRRSEQVDFPGCSSTRCSSRSSGRPQGDPGDHDHLRAGLRASSHSRTRIFMGILVALMVPSQVSLLPNYVLIAGARRRRTPTGASSCRASGRRSAPSCCGSTSCRCPRDPGGRRDRRRRAPAAAVVASSYRSRRPTIATVALVTIVNEWNDYIWPLIITTDDSLMTLPVGLTLLHNIEGDPQLATRSSDGRRGGGHPSRPDRLHVPSALHRRRPHRGCRASNHHQRSRHVPQSSSPARSSRLPRPRRPGVGAMALSACSGPTVGSGSASAAFNAAGPDFSGVKPATSITFWSNHPGKSRGRDAQHH